MDLLLCPQSKDDDPVESTLESKRYSLFLGNTDLQKLQKGESPIDYIGKEHSILQLQIVSKHAAEESRDSMTLALMAEVTKKKNDPE